MRKEQFDVKKKSRTQTKKEERSISVNRQQKAKRAEYKQTLISQETEVDISDLGDMMVRPSAETETETETETTKAKTKASKTPKATEKTSEETTEAQ